ncbi:MAG: peptidase M14 [Ignavibacteriales bacterium]|nr:peptidase M14 [Ignavibacteriales bacterium]
MRNLKGLQGTDHFTITRIGYSYLNRDICLVRLGTGPIKIFLWSQMHGDEPTATASLFDFFNIFTSKQPYLSDLKHFLLNNFTFFVIPMLNPDGAENFNRRNAQDIDLNRDVIKNNTPETRLLIECFKTIKPDFCYNLHDQSTLYSVGMSPQQVMFSFLAPPYDYGKSINPNRLQAMKVIAALKDMLEHFVPDHTARYNDDFEPRAIGDYFQSKGVPTILIECGGLKTDPNKEYIRRMHTLILIHSFISIAQHQYEEYTPDDYFTIPQNEKHLYDVVLRNVYFPDMHKMTDIGINYNYQYDSVLQKLNRSGIIEEIGDLTGYYGLTDMNAEGMTVIPGKVRGGLSPEIDTVKLQNMIKDGYCAWIANTKISSEEFPFITLDTENLQKSFPVERNKRACFTLLYKDKPHYNVIDGILINISAIPFRCANNIAIN